MNPINMAFRYDPFERMDRMFDMMRQSMETDGAPWLSDYETDSHLSLESTDDGYLVVADLPGFDRDDLTLRFDDGVLTIQGEHDVDEESAYGHTSRHRSVHEQMTIPAEVIEDDVTATYRNGVLEVHLPTVEEIDDDEKTIEIN